jgi:hypothetical protein
VLGMMLIGYAFSLGWEFWQRHPSATTSKLALVASLMFVPIALRGGLGDTFARALFGIIPLFLAARVCRRRREVTGPLPQLGRSTVVRR